MKCENKRCHEEAEEIRRWVGNLYLKLCNRCEERLDDFISHQNAFREYRYHQQMCQAHGIKDSDTKEIFEMHFDSMIESGNDLRSLIRGWLSLSTENE